MTLRRLAERLQWALHSGDGEGPEVRAVIAGDLMSDVLRYDREVDLILTSLTTDQVLRTADLVGAAAVIIVNGKSPTPSMVDIAGEFQLTLAASPLPMYETCCRLHAALEEDACL